MRRLFATAALASALQVTCAGLASAQEMYLGEVRQFAYNWCPVGWAQAAGQILAINTNAALFSLLGTNFGGNGVNTFGLPNLNGRAPYGFGAPGQPFAAVYGNSTVTLTTGNMPAHTHQLFGSSAAPAQNSPSGASDATFPSAEKIYAAPASPTDAPMNPRSIGMTGQSQPFSVQSPALAMNWCIATVGIYPSRP
jgi:microcystin-dependent protein